MLTSAEIYTEKGFTQILILNTFYQSHLPHLKWCTHLQHRDQTFIYIINTDYAILLLLSPFSVDINKITTFKIAFTGKHHGMK